MKIRPEILKFARAMETKLRLHDKVKGKTGWRGDKKLHFIKAPKFLLLEMLHQELEEYERTLNNSRYPGIGDKDELPDIANFCMMLFDIS